MRGLTARQSAILDFIERFRRERGFSPSLRDIAAGAGLRSAAAALGHVRALCKKNRLRQAGHTARSLEVVG